MKATAIRKPRKKSPRDPHEAKRKTSKRKKSTPSPVVLQIIPADPRWHALFEDDEGPHTTPLVCFALVELGTSGGRPFRVVRPMIVHDVGDAGVIDDVNRRKGFVCLLPPCGHEDLPEDLLP